MHRLRLRELLIILGAVSVILALTVAGCRWRRSYEGGNSYQYARRPLPSGPSKIKTLRLNLIGPFVVLVRQELHNRITAYLPKDGDGVHEFTYPNPESPQTRFKSYHFELSEQGLEISRDRPYVDHGFDDFNVTLANWPPKHPPENYVVLDLPAPDVITYIPPLEGVIFGPESSPRFGRLPENHVLEYKVRDGSKVIMRSPELGERPPTPDCEKKDRDGNQEHSEDPSISRDFELCGQSATYYFGIRLSPGLGSKNPPMDLKEHAKNFFNERVLPSLFEKPVPEDKKLLRLGADPHRDGRLTGSAPLIIPAALRYSQFSGPRIIYIGYPGSGGSLCLAPAVTVKTAGKTPTK